MVRQGYILSIVACYTLCVVAAGQTQFDSAGHVRGRLYANSSLGVTFTCPPKMSFYSTKTDAWSFDCVRLAPHFAQDDGGE